MPAISAPITAGDFDALRDASRAIAAARSREDVLTAVGDAAARLLRGERCLVVPLPLTGADEAAFESLDDLDPRDLPLIDRAVAGHAPAVSDARSALCAPIFVRGTAVACLYTSHSGVGEPFGEEEQRLAAFIAVLAGGALESRNAETLHDPLTGLANRALFTDRVKHALRRAGRMKARIAVLLLDLDDFKTVNDSLGHTAGDQLLVSVAGRLGDCVRDADTAARLGGDEFAILVEDVRDAADAAGTAQRIIDTLAAPFALDTPAGGSEVFVQPSIGIALGSTGGASAGAGELLRNAEVAMSIAKDRGKRRYEFFEPSMHTGIVERMALKRDLSHALERGEFVLHYQPIIALATGELTGLEALIRWHHPERGLVPPAAFVPLAEETGQIRPIGHWVLGEACRQAAGWGETRGARRPLSVNVNLSPLQLQEPGFVGEVAAALSRSGLAPSQLLLEITETVLMQDTEVTIRRLRRLKDLGVRLAIDDFGTG